MDNNQDNGQGAAEGEQQISSEQVRQMMANAQKMIEERKRQLALAQAAQGIGIPGFNQAPVQLPAPGTRPSRSGR